MIILTDKERTRFVKYLKQEAKIFAEIATHATKKGVNNATLAHIRTYELACERIITKLEDIHEM